jgi:hypothetical protein
MNSRLHSFLACVVLCGGLTCASCSRPSSVVAPTAAAPAARQAIQDERFELASPGTGKNQFHEVSDAAVFPLLAGSFAIVNRDGDGIEGTYTGVAQAAPGALQKSSLSMQVSNGSGSFAGAVGTLDISGAGSFAEEGAFLLDGGGALTLAGGKRAVLVLTLRGESLASCSPSGRIAIGQTAGGTMARAGRVTARLSHVVGGTGCVP